MSLTSPLAWRTRFRRTVPHRTPDHTSFLWTFDTFHRPTRVHQNGARSSPLPIRRQRLPPMFQHIAQLAAVKSCIREWTPTSTAWRQTSRRPRKPCDRMRNPVRQNPHCRAVNRSKSEVLHLWHGRKLTEQVASHPLRNKQETTCKRNRIRTNTRQTHKRVQEENT